MRLALKWISIEGMDKKLFSEKSDVWYGTLCHPHWLGSSYAFPLIPLRSYGVTLWEIASYGSTPYGQVKTADIQVGADVAVRQASVDYRCCRTRFARGCG